LPDLLLIVVFLWFFFLGSLCCDNAEEAKSLIPSLQSKISENDLQELLDELTKLRNFVE
jgi:DNA-directed RNA polymerase II subunit RPB4